MYFSMYNSLTDGLCDNLMNFHTWLLHDPLKQIKKLQFICSK